MWMGEGAVSWATLEWDSWHAWGAYHIGSAAGEDNANHFEEFGLTFEEIVRRSIFVQNEKGFLYQDQTELVVGSISDSNVDLKTLELTFWNLPICDLGAALGDDQYISSDHEDGSNNDDPR